MNNIQKALKFAVDTILNEEYNGIFEPFIVGLNPEYKFIELEKDIDTLENLIEKGRSIIRKESKKKGDCILVYEGLLYSQYEDGTKDEDKAIVFEIVDTEIRHYQKFYIDNDGFYKKGEWVDALDKNNLTGYEDF